MGLMDSLRNFFSKPQTKVSTPLPPSEPDEEEVYVPEVSVADLLAGLKSAAQPLLLDVREAFEWRQARIPAKGERAVVHIPMNDVPNHLDQLPKDKEIIVFCAHGSRSYGVTAWLIEQGYQARNLAGGITQWHVQGGEVETQSASGGGAGGWK